MTGITWTYIVASLLETSVMFDMSHCYSICVTEKVEQISYKWTEFTNGAQGALTYSCLLVCSSYRAYSFITHKTIISNNNNHVTTWWN